MVSRKVRVFDAYIPRRFDLVARLNGNRKPGCLRKERFRDIFVGIESRNVRVLYACVLHRFEYVARYVVILDRNRKPGRLREERSENLVALSPVALVQSSGVFWTARAKWASCCICDC